MPGTRRLILIIIVLYFFLLFLAVPGVSWSQTPPSPWQDAAREFSRKIAAITGPRHTIVLAVRNISSLSDSEVAAVRAALESELRAAGLRLTTKPNSAADLRVTLSENLEGLLWVAEVTRDESHEVVMALASRARADQELPADFQITIRKQFIIDSGKPILDFLLSNPASYGQGELLILDTESLMHFRSEGQKWQRTDSSLIPANIFWPRDPRGRLERKEPSIAVYLPGAKCEGVTWQSLRLQCGSATGAEDIWNLSGVESELVRARMNPVRNYFEGSLPITPQSEARVPPFYSIAEIDGIAHLWILTSTEQGLHIFSERNYSGTLKSVRAQSGWGSDLASVRSSCGRHEQLLLTKTGDWTEPDVVQAYEIVDGKPLEVSPPVEFPGPVTALWPGDTDHFANLVIRNLKTGRYEAYTLTLSCGR